VLLNSGSPFPNLTGDGRIAASFTKQPIFLRYQRVITPMRTYYIVDLTDSPRRNRLARTGRCMHFAGGLSLLAIVSMALASGCQRAVLPIEAVAGRGIAKTVARDDQFDLQVTGSQCNVVVDRGVVRSLTVNGDNHVVTIDDAAMVSEVSIYGNGNRVDFPNGVNPPQVFTWGNSNSVE
jgi:hypothetical protein